MIIAVTYCAILAVLAGVFSHSIFIAFFLMSPILAKVIVYLIECKERKKPRIC